MTNHHNDVVVDVGDVGGIVGGDDEVGLVAYH